jgi:hypothetical protein
MDDNEHPLLQSLLLQLSQMAAADGYSVADAVDLEKCGNILEATAGDVNLAAQLYWDDFLATWRGAGARQPAAALQLEPRQQEDELRADSEGHLAASGEIDSTRVRRRLEREFEHQAENRLNNEEEGEEENLGDHPDAGAARRFILARETARRREGIQARDQEQNIDDGDANIAGLVVRAAEAFLAAREEASVSVSDDESGGVWRMMGGDAARLDKRGISVSSDHSPTPKRKRRKTDENIDLKANRNTDDDAYLSDNDWLWESLVSRANIPLCTPCK